MAAGLADALRTSTELIGGTGDRSAASRRVTDGLAGLSADLQLLGPQIVSAGKAARWAVVRRSADEFRATDHTGVASVVRRPLHLMVDDLVSW